VNFLRAFIRAPLCTAVNFLAALERWLTADPVDSATARVKAAIATLAIAAAAGGLWALMRWWRP
jgi:hypothetical protein